MVLILLGYIYLCNHSAGQGEADAAADEAPSLDALFQEHKAVVLLLIAVVSSEAFTSECPGVYTMNKAKSGCNGIWSNG